LCANCHRKTHASNRVVEEEYFRDAVYRNVEWLRNFKNTLCCSECGIKDERVLDFHHLGNKTGTVCRLLLKGCSVKRLLDEINQCLVTCANCHRKKHNGNVWLENSNTEY
jgi:hypothetical protein